MNQDTVKSTVRRIFTTLAFFLLAGVLGWFSWFHLSAWNSEERFWKEGIESLEEMITSGSFPRFKEAFQKAQKDYPTLQALTLTSPNGVLLVTSRHPQIRVPDGPQALPPLYYPVFPWEQVVSKTLRTPQGPVVLQYFYQSLSRSGLFESLKTLLFLLLGLMGLSLVMWGVTRENEPEETSEPEDELTRETQGFDDELPPLNTRESLQSEPEEEEFWIRDDSSLPREEDLDFDLPPLSDFETTPELSEALPPIDLPAPTVQEHHRPFHEGSKSSTDPFDSESGAMREEFLSFRLESELQRASDHNQDLVLAYICPDHPLKPGEPRLLRELLGEFFPYKDLIFQRRDLGFTLLLPQKTLDVAVKELGNLFKRPPMAKFSARITAGLSSRSGRLLDPETLQKETERALEKAKSGHETIIGFRADPEKYRRHLGS